MRPALLASLAIALTACATPRPKIVPRYIMDPELYALDLLNTWSCEIQPAPGATPVPPFRYTVEPELGGAFLAGRVELQPPDPAQPIITRDSWGFDPVSRDTWGFDPVSREIFRSFRTREGDFGTLRTRGWEGDRLVLLGEAVFSGQRSPARETLQRTGPSQFNARWEKQTPDGTWTTFSNERCAWTRPGA